MDLIKSVDDLKKTQAHFQEYLTDIDKRLKEVECKAVVLQEFEEQAQHLHQSFD